MLDTSIVLFDFKESMFMPKKKLVKQAQTKVVVEMEWEVFLKTNLNSVT